MKTKMFVVLAICAMLAASFPAMAAPTYDPSVNGLVTEWQPTFFDDFNQESGRWTYPTTSPANAAVRTAGYIRLTPNTNTQVGVIWFDTQVTFDFQVEFDYRIGGGTVADGMVFMFYKDQAYTPVNGGSLGFVGASGTAPGYGVEFDTYWNGGYNDPGSNYMGIIKDKVSNHLNANYVSTLRNNVWHHIKVIVDGPTISVYYDNMDNPRFAWTGPIDKTYGGFGFAAATGGQNDNHYIDNVLISKKVTYVVEDGQVTNEVTFVPGGITDRQSESPTWTMIAGNTALLAITVFVVVMVAHGIRRKKK